MQNRFVTMLKGAVAVGQAGMRKFVFGVGGLFGIFRAQLEVHTLTAFRHGRKHLVCNKRRPGSA